MSTNTKEYQRKWYLANQEVVKKRSLKRYYSHREEILRKAKEKCAASGKMQEWIKRRHGIKRPWQKIQEQVGSVYGYWTIIGDTTTQNTHGEYLWPCRCVCGKEALKTGVVLRNSCSKSCGCQNLARRRGPSCPNWKTGRTQHPNSGYWMIKDWDHPNADKRGYVYEQVYIMSKYIGRALKKGEYVHHKNGIRSDNRLSNLELWTRKDPPGQRVKDKLQWCIEFIQEYAPHLLTIEPAGPGKEAEL